MLHALPHVADRDKVDFDPSRLRMPDHHGHVGGNWINFYFLQLTGFHERGQSQARLLLFRRLPSRQRSSGLTELDQILEAHQADASIFQEAEESLRLRQAVARLLCCRCCGHGAHGGCPELPGLLLSVRPVRRSSWMFDGACAQFQEHPV